VDGEHLHDDLHPEAVVLHPDPAGQAFLHVQQVQGRAGELLEDPCQPDVVRVGVGEDHRLELGRLEAGGVQGLLQG
jgi:hypothetical protein